MPDTARGATLARLAGEMDRLDAQSQTRKLALPSGIDLMSNDYLGLSRHPKLREAVRLALEAGEAMASGGSRLLSGNARIWEDLEEEFAAFAGGEAALFFGSGYAANTGLLSSLLRSGDVVFSDSSNHASLIDGIRLSRARKIIFPHLDLNFLEDHLRQEPGKAGEKFIVVESVFSMEGDRAPLPELARLADAYGAAFIVDEAHAAGVFGPEGRGLIAEAALSGAALARVFPCGKALACCGAFVVGSAALKNFLVNRARPFIFSTALPPYLARQIHTALALAREAEAQRACLRRLALTLRTRLQESGLNTGSTDTHIVPVILGTNDLALEAAQNLGRAGFAIRAIRPPTVPPGTSRLRISLNASLSMETIERVTHVLSSMKTIAPA